MAICQAFAGCRRQDEASQPPNNSGLSLRRPTNCITKFNNSNLTEAFAPINSLGLLKPHSELVMQSWENFKGALRTCHNMWKLKFTSQLKRRPGTGPRPVEILFFVYFAAPFWQAEHLIWHIAVHILAARRRQQSAQVQPQWRQQAAFCCKMHTFFTTCQRTQAAATCDGSLRKTARILQIYGGCQRIHRGLENRIKVSNSMLQYTLSADVRRI